MRLGEERENEGGDGARKGGWVCVFFCVCVFDRGVLFPVGVLVGGAGVCVRVWACVWAGERLSGRRVQEKKQRA